MKKKAFVTGASGYMGTHLVERLLKEGWDVTAYDLQKSIRFPEEVHFISGDIRDAQKVKGAAADCNVIFHLVGIMPQAKAKPDMMRSVNVEGTKHALDAAVANQCKRVVFLSSCEVYGAWDDAPVKEDAPARPIGNYGKNKLEAEALGKEYSEKYGIAFIALRPSTLAGKNMTDYLFRSIMKGILKSPFLFYTGSGQNRFQMSAIEDVADACILSAEKEHLTFEIFNIGADDVLPMGEQLQEISKKMGLNKKMVPVPALLAKRILYCLAFLGASPFVPDHFEMLDKDIMMDCSRAKKILGWKAKKSNVDMFVEALQSYKTGIKEKNN